MSAFAALAAELDAWAACGRRLSLWWRDDDAMVPSAALERLLALVADQDLPLCLAVVPEGTGPALADRLARAHRVAIAQHGFAHRNHAGRHAKKSEYPPGRAQAAALAELAAGRTRLAALFGPRLMPVLVPPWNRIAPALLPALPGLGFAALSTFGPRAAAAAAPGLVQVNTHVDPVAWHGGRGFLGADAALAPFLAHLARCRQAWTADEDAKADEACGLLTHHLAMDEAGWHFTARFLAATAAHPAVRWLDIGQAMAGG